jgi:DNA (cytosine-5)-methyltransferase 1
MGEGIMIIVDLFSGAGGLSEGFHELNCEIVAQVEKDYWACETLKTRAIYHYLKNIEELPVYFEYLRRSPSYEEIPKAREYVFGLFPELRERIETQILNKKFGNPANDPEATSTREIIELIDKALNGRNVDMIIGGPPCQVYSLVGRGRLREEAEKDPRNFLFYYYLTLVKTYKPKVFVFENVPGILTAKKGKLFEKIQEEFLTAGYTILSGSEEDHRKNIIDMSDFGIPQRRKRVILFGFKSELNLTYPDFHKYAIKWDHEMNTRNVISDLPTLQPGQGADYGILDYNNNGDLSSYQRYMRKNSIGVLNHKARPVRDQDRNIYNEAIRLASRGLQLRYPDLPENLKTHQNEKSFTDRFKVHWWDRVPHTIVAHISKDGHYNIHPDSNQLRSLTVREAARIQGFPDNYRFEGPRTAQYVQVGNAVPPIMSSIIANAVIAELAKVPVGIT